MRMSSFAFASSALMLAPLAHALTIQDFIQCIGAKGQGAVCQLDAGTQPISTTLLVGRSNLTIKGTILSSRRDTILQRAVGFRGNLLQDVRLPTTPLTSITIRDLTIDGNRAQNQGSYTSYAPDLALFSTGSVLITNCDF